ncbi:MAG: hypothetical protein EA388_00060 [Nitriliruptor sp.]|nr:MAG: hypothetical protein EA388_00060 [Nitriliruptor sp.]
MLSVVAILGVPPLAGANAVAVWRRPMPAGLFPWLLAGWGARPFDQRCAYPTAAWRCATPTL